MRIQKFKTSMGLAICTAGLVIALADLVQALPV